jgi:hypothetical protein
LKRIAKRPFESLSLSGKSSGTLSLGPAKPSLENMNSPAAGLAESILNTVLSMKSKTKRFESSPADTTISVAHKFT